MKKKLTILGKKEKCEKSWKIMLYLLQNRDVPASTHNIDKEARSGRLYTQLWFMSPCAALGPCEV